MAIGNRCGGPSAGPQVLISPDMPWVIKIGIGTLALAGVLVYQWVLGRRAWRAGHTGDLDEFEAGAKQLISS